MNRHDGNRGREGWSWGLPFLSYFPSGGRFAPPGQAQYDWNIEQFGVDDEFADKSVTGGGSRPLPYASQSTSESSTTRSGNHEKIFEFQVRRFCCEGCVNKVEKRVRNISGISSARCNLDDKTVTIVGSVDPEIILTTLKTIRYLDPKLLSHWQVDSTES